MRTMRNGDHAAVAAVIARNSAGGTQRYPEAEAETG